MKLAILDDYQSVAMDLVDWSSVTDLQVIPFQDHVYNEDELIGRLSDFDAVMRIRERTEFSRQVLESLPNLRIILATGMRNVRSIDLVAAGELDITVCTTDALHQTTVEVTWLLILAMFRGFPQEYASVKSGGWQYGLGIGLDGKTLGIVGLGNMGTPVAKIGQGFGMKVIAWSPNLTPERAQLFGVECVSKNDLFRRSDVVTVHMPHVNSTEGLVNKDCLSLMKPHAFLVNTSRPKLIEEPAFTDALKSGRIAGAGLDVFDIEPLPRDHPFRYLKNVISTPHIGFVTRENYEIFFKESLENLKAYLEGEPIRVITADTPFLAGSQAARRMHKGKV